MYIMVSQGMHFNVLKMRILRQFMACQAMNRKFFIVQRTEKHHIMSIRPAKCWQQGLEVTGLTRDYPEGYTPRLQFNHVDTELKDGINAQKVNIPFDSKPYFTYNTEDGLYYRYQYGEAHIDRENDEQLAFKNIIVQYVAQKSISKQDYQDMTLNGSGKGLYITDGKAEEITWKRNDNADKTKYYDASGNEISLNPGKTFFEVVSDSKTVTLE